MHTVSPSCPAVLTVENRHTHSQMSKQCGADPLACGFCIAHKYCRDMLNLLASIGYPGLQINAALSVERGAEAWQEYIVRLPAPGVRFGFFDGSMPRFIQVLMAADDYRKLVYPNNARIADVFTRFQTYYFREEGHVEPSSAKKTSHSTRLFNFAS